MASESVATRPDTYGTDPVHGNFTDEAETHLWCAQALATLVASPEESLSSLNDDLQEALRYLLQREVSRARSAAQAKGRRA